MKFFFDNNLPPSLAKAADALLQPLGHSAIHLRDKFPPDVKDTDWITSLGNEGGWVVISGDQRITKNPHERAAWKSAKLTGFFLAKAWMHHELWEQAWRLIRWLPSIIKQSEMVSPPAAFEVPINYNGKFSSIA